MVIISDYAQLHAVRRPRAARGAGRWRAARDKGGQGAAAPRAAVVPRQQDGSRRSHHRGAVGDRASAQRRKTVQAYAVRVRKMLEPRGRAADGSVLPRRGAGYALSVSRGQVDALQFADLVATARKAAAAGAHDIAARLLGEALSLWRGAAYADFQDTLFGATEAARLEEMRLAALEARIDADLALGRHAEVTAELEALVHECPLRERFWCQLMLALYRSGRQSDALLAFRRARRSLTEEIGVEPGPELCALEAAILAHDPGLSAPDASSAGPPELPVELCRIGPAFVARDGELARLVACWAEAEGRGRAALRQDVHARHAPVEGRGQRFSRRAGARRVDAVRHGRAQPVYLVDAKTFARIAGPIDTESTATSAFSPNGRMLAVAAYSGPGLALLTVPSGRVRWSNGSFADATSLGFSPDGRRIVAG